MPCSFLQINILKVFMTFNLLMVSEHIVKVFAKFPLGDFDPVPLNVESDTQSILTPLRLLA